MKHLFRTYFFLAFFCIILHTAQAQNHFSQLSNEAEISLITIGPGPELYDSFGHTAIRVKDLRRDIDWVFNYGRFNFNTPNFYIKFARGKLLYTLWVNHFDEFIEDYKQQRRWVKEQTLALNTKEKQLFFDFLKNNAKDENREYLYDFFFDNCATRPVNAIAGIMGKELIFDYNDFPDGRTHRELIRENVPWNSWGALGMDVAIGSVTDRLATKEEYLFLPNYTMQVFENATISKDGIGKSFISKTKMIFVPDTENIYKERFITSPILIIGLLSLLLMYKTYKDYKNKKGINYIDTVILAVTGVIGILLALLWFATEHGSTKWNYNLLWAFPFHVFAAFIITKVNPPRWIYPYIKLTIILLVLLCFHWIVGVQSYSYSLIPLFIALGLRYLYIVTSLRKIRDTE
ncbi:DUF4105 domain-containing protein [Dokdonia sp.]|uniref:lipoprotein N-acyltransferase Lnb domain-containing protein n=1 Tax=Dokdonia sp. TaxID=2024995 RepID=UPI003264F62E